MVVMLMAGAKRHLGLNGFLQLGGLCKQFPSWVVMQAVMAVVAVA